MNLVAKLTRELLPARSSRTHDGTYYCQSCNVSFKSPDKWCSGCQSILVEESNTRCESCGSILFDTRRQHCPLCESTDIDQLE